MKVDLKPPVLDLEVVVGSTFFSTIYFLGTPAVELPLDFTTRIVVTTSSGEPVAMWSKELPIVEGIVAGKVVYGCYLEYQGAESESVADEYLKYTIRAVYSDGAEQTLVRGNIILYGE